MFQWFFEGNRLVPLHLIGMGIFIGVFVLVVCYVWLVMGRHGDDLSRVAGLPLADDTGGEKWSEGEVDNV